MISLISITHHPKPETLEEFAAGRLDEARAIVIAAYLAKCPQSATHVRDLEALGGAVLESTPPVAMSDGAFSAVLDRIDRDAPTEQSATSHRTAAIKSLLEGKFDHIKWRAAAPGLSQCQLDADGYKKGALRLLKIAPGTKIPKHSHGESELTLILRGAYEDEIGAFREGDIADLDPNNTHSPKAIGDEPCICLAATSAPLVFKTLAGRLAQPFVGL